MDKPVIAQKFRRVKLEAGKEYHWCSCGVRKNQPFCDGLSAPRHFSRPRFKVEKDGEYHLCGMQDDEESAVLRRFVHKDLIRYM